MASGDVLAHTRPAQVTVTCFGRPWRLPLLTAEQWIGAMGWDFTGLTGVLPGAIADEDLDDMWNVSRGSLEPERHWLNAARVAVTRASGRDWWWAVNLTQRCLQSWPYINGLLILQGVDAAAMRLPSWLDAAYMLLWQRTDQAGRDALDLELSIPPRGVSPAQAPVATSNMLAAFAAD